MESSGPDLPERPAHILLVDDDPILRELLQDTLDSIGYTAEAAANGFEAMQKLRHTRFDLVITDIRMPGMDGISLAKRIREFNPRVPVLFITGVASPEVVGQASPVGFLAKPFRISHIEQLIKDALAQREERASRPIRRVMVVDDDDLFRDMLTQTLVLHGYATYAFPNGDRALEELQRGSFDAVITDIRMPGMDGISLMKEVKAKHPDLPVILVTAYFNRSELSKDPSLSGPDGFLQKPFEAERLIELLSSLSPSAARGNSL